MTDNLTLVVGTNHPALLQWCEERVGNGAIFKPKTAVAVALLDKDNDYEPSCVAVMDGWFEHHCEVSMASDGSRRWQIPEFKDAVYGYIFNTRGCARMNLVIRVGNDAANACQERLGHTKEGRLKDWFGADKDAFLWAYTKQEWLASRGEAAINKS